MIYYTPIDLPRLTINDWDKFNLFWEENAKPLFKRKNNTETSPATLGRSALWRGFDIFRTNISTSYFANYVEIKNLFPELDNSIQLILAEIPSTSCIRLIQSLEDVASHTDDNRDEWKIRGMLHYTSNKNQWYFTKPNDSERMYISTDENMWFAYNDKYVWHGTDFDPNHKKILVQLYTNPILTEDKLIQTGISKYTERALDG